MLPVNYPDLQELSESVEQLHQVPDGDVFGQSLVFLFFLHEDGPQSSLVSNFENEVKVGLGLIDIQKPDDVLRFELHHYPYFLLKSVFRVVVLFDFT